MPYGNPIKHKIQNVFCSWLDMLSIEWELTDDKMNFMHLAICDYTPIQVE